MGVVPKSSNARSSSRLTLKIENAIVLSCADVSEIIKTRTTTWFYKQEKNSRSVLALKVGSVTRACFQESCYSTGNIRFSNNMNDMKCSIRRRCYFPFKRYVTLDLPFVQRFRRMLDCCHDPFRIISGVAYPWYMTRVGSKLVLLYFTKTVM